MIRSIFFRTAETVVSLIFYSMIANSGYLYRPAMAAVPASLVSVASPYDFKTLQARLEESATKNDMLVVAKASASAGAEKRGVRIPGDAVSMIFRNDYAVRMLQAEPAAGLEAPIHIHIFATPDGKASIAYRRPSVVFRPYRNPKLDALAKELDKVFAKIVADAVGR